MIQDELELKSRSYIIEITFHEFVGDACSKRHMPHSTEIQPSHPWEVEVGLSKKFKALFDDTLVLGSRWLN